VLDWSRADAGSLSVSPTVNRFGRAVQEALADVDAQAVAARVALTDATSGAVADLPYVGDEPRVRQILVNLLTNAIKFTPAGGHITISGGTAETVADVQLPGTGPWVYLRVEDTGRGIPADRLQTIFEPYQQTDSTDHRRGTGLGLSISRQLARLMGGDVGVRSEPGAGSSFTLWLPMATSDDVPR